MINDYKNATKAKASARINDYKNVKQLGIRLAVFTWGQAPNSPFNT